MGVIRSIFRHKLRTMFTIVGIIVGIIALTVMGAMAEKINLMVDDAINYYNGQITVTPKGGTGFLSSISPEVIKDIEKIKGVKTTMRELMIVMDPSGEIQMGMPNLIDGYDLDTNFVNVNDTKLRLQSGRQLKKGDDFKAVVGADIAKDKKVKVEEKIKLRKKYFDVIGISEKNMTVTDTMVLIPLKNAQRLYVDSNSYLKDIEKRAKETKDIPKEVLAKMDLKTQKQMKEVSLFDASELSNSVAVSWDKGVNPEKLAKKIENKVEDISVQSPKEGEKQLKQAMQVLNLVILGSALIAVVVGGLSVINTMIMAVHERTREIGVKKAIGARTGHILAEYILESALLGLLGGLIGLAIGVGIVNIINAQTLKSGVQIFEVTTRLALLSLGFSTVLGSVAGIYPAVHAARLNPVEALRYE